MIEITTGERKEDAFPQPKQVPGCRVQARPVGVLRMRNEKGEDYKIIAVPIADPRFEGVDDLTDVHPHWLRQIENFFAVYKALEPEKLVTIAGWGGGHEAWDAIRACRS